MTTGGNAGRVGLPFEVLAFGRFEREGLRVLYSPEERGSCAELEALIESEWAAQVEAARGTRRLLFNGRLFRYVSHEIVEGAGGSRFDLRVGPTCYKDFVGTNLFNGRRVEEFGWERFSNAVGTTATVMTRDGRICYGRRSERVSYHAGHVHTFGGALEESDRGADGRIDAFGSLMRELWEELGLRKEDVEEVYCVGLIRDREIHQPELLFEARVGLKAAEVRERWRGAESRDEHEEVVELADSAAAVIPFIRSCALIAPVAVGALMLHGRLAWGERWFEDAGRGL